MTVAQAGQAVQAGLALSCGSADEGESTWLINRTSFSSTARGRTAPVGAPPSRLQAAGYRVTAPQFALTKLADDVARLRQVLARQGGPTVVAGHSYGGQIITALGDDAPNVVRLVYIAGFGLEEGESIGASGLLGSGLS
jgi:pimeloyl-ACP methyl ester carboxylesterase